MDSFVLGCSKKKKSSERFAPWWKHVAGEVIHSDMVHIGVGFVKLYLGTKMWYFSKSTLQKNTKIPLSDFL